MSPANFIPTGVVRLKTVVAHILHLCADDDTVALRLTLEGVEGWSGAYRSASRETTLAGPVKRFRAGDVLFGKLRPYLAKVVCPDRAGLCVGEFLVLRPKGDRVHPQFLSYWLRAKPVVDIISSSTFGAKMPRTEWRFIANLRFPLPPIAEQTRLTAYLNEVTTDVDVAIGMAQEQMALLAEQRRTMMSRVVTQGLDGSAPLRTSGIPWLGDVPKHWSVQRVKAVTQILNGGTPSTSVPSFWDGSIRWITPDDLGGSSGRTISSGARSITTDGYAACGATTAPAGSIVLSTRAPIGHVAILSATACTNQGCRILVPRRIRSEYLYYLIVVLRDELESLGRGTTFPELSASSLGGVRVPTPPIAEQAAIVRHLDKATADIEAAIAEVRREIELLKEYRARLIADVVTGRLDVREVAGSLPGPNEEGA